MAYENEISLKSYCKVNLLLKILSKREDGYHNLSMINQCVSLYDEIKLRKNLSGASKINTIGLDIKNEDNIVYKLIDYLNNNITHISVDIEIKKNIPDKAGLGGGSSNCGSVLKALNKIYNLNMDINQMINISKNLGADVPFFIYEGTAVVKGIGDEIYPIKSPTYYYVIIKPDISFDTKKAYNKYDKLNYIQKIDLYEKFCDKIDNNFILSKEFIKEECCNDFEKLFVSKYPVIDELKNALIASGAFYSQLTGSGSCVFGIFETEETSESAYKNLKKIYKNIFKCKTVSDSFKLGGDIG